jgi:taurine dioxygenase
MRFERLTAAIGVEVHDLDLTRPLGEADRRALKEAWLEHLVLVVRDKTDLTPEMHIDFAKSFAPADDANFVSFYGHDKHSQIVVLSNETQDGKPSETRDIGWNWHADLTYTLRPSSGAVLHAQAVPEVGGDTLFTNMRLAYERLSPAYQRMIEGLECIHDFTNSEWYVKRREADPSAEVRKTPPVVQPMVRIHPETGRKSLYIGQTAVAQIHGMTKQESKPILDYLHAHATQHDFLMRHRWRRGDLLVWDNRSTLHKVVHDHDSVVAPGTPGKVRRMHRITLEGQPSGRPFAAEAAE